MRAVVFDSFGEPVDVLQARNIAEPQPRSGEVRVRMLASPINPSDLMTIRGVYGQRPDLPATPGYEGVGIVEANGGGILGRMFVGKRVAVLNRVGGNWAEKTVLPANQCVPLPADLPIEQAAMFFVNPVTAYVMTRKVLAVRSGEWLLQSAAGSSLGQMVIRLAKHTGFKTINIVRRAEQAEELKRLGADATAVFDGDRDDPSSLVDQVLHVTRGGGVRYAIDPVGGRTGTAMTRCLRDKGRMLLYGNLSTEPIELSSRDLLTYTASVEGFWLAKWFAAAKLPRRLATVRTVANLMRAGVLVNDVGRAFSLEEITDAVRHSETKARGGKAWLKIADA
ncbi:MAG: zinc-dependent alcohol dehydrogenase family protein [Planctomycetaceae bacterium]|nr:zinc-dependent alcohol dehydrogenase family protein [Planctomycetaceae bacterium]